LIVWNPPGIAWNPCGNVWNPLGIAWNPPGIAWNPPGIAWNPYGNVWNPYKNVWNPHGNAWNPYGNVWNPHGNAWNPYGIHLELHGIHMEMYGIHLELHGIHMEMYGIHVNSWNRTIPCGFHLECGGTVKYWDSAATITKLLKVNEHLQTKLSQSVTTWSSQTKALTEAAQSKLLSSDTRLKEAQKEVSKLRKAFHQAIQTKEHAVETAKAKVIQEKSVHHLSHKGVFTQKTHNLVRFLFQAGCSANRINEIITAVLKSAGITVVGSISHTSVARIIREGYFAAQIQLGHEMKMAETMTFSADGTGHRSINYNSQHAHMLVEDYGSSDGRKTRATRFLGIKPFRDGSSKEAIADWQTTIIESLDLYNRSPFEAVRRNPDWAC